MVKWLHVSVSQRRTDKKNPEKLNLTRLISNESLRLQPPVPGGSQRSVNKGAGRKVLGKWYADVSIWWFLTTVIQFFFVGSSQRKRKLRFTYTAFSVTREISTLPRHSYHNDGSVPAHLRGIIIQLLCSRSHMDRRTVQGRILR